MELTPGMKALTPFMRVIEGAAAAHMTTAALWNAVRDQAAANGINLKGASIFDMNRMRALGGQMAAATAAFAALPENGIIPSGAVSQAFYSRPLADQALVPSYEINYQRISSTPEGQLVEWRTLVINARLPITKAEIIDQVTAAAAAEVGPQGTPQGTQLDGIGAIRILSV